MRSERPGRDGARRGLERALGPIMLLLAGHGVAGAQISDTLTPKHHGALQAAPARGSIDPDTGVSRLRLGGWVLQPAAESNGVFPADEPILIALGEENFRIDKGMLRASRSGRRFVYRSSKSVHRGVRSMRLERRPDGSYEVRLVLFNLGLSRLLLNFPDCVPMAILIGDDDGFTGVDLDRKSFRSKRLMLRGGCEPNEDWVWLEQCGPDAPPEGC